jgi:hypothetical protein
MTATRSDTAKLGWLTESPPPTIILVGERTLPAPRTAARLLGVALRATTIVVPGADVVACAMKRWLGPIFSPANNAGEQAVGKRTLAELVRDIG